MARTTKFKPIYCKKVKEYLSQGYSKRATAGLLDIHEDTLYEWIKVFPEFARAVQIGSQKGEAKYTKLMLAMAEGNKGNANAAIFMLKNLFRYSENIQEDLDDKKPINIVFTIDKPKDGDGNS